VLYRVRDAVAVLTLNRPERHNGQTVASERLLESMFARADNDPTVRAIVLTGAGHDFCVGADVNQLESATDDEEMRTEMPLANARFGAGVRKPVAAAIDGACAGGGLLFAASCDVRFASTKARFSTAYTKLGIVPEWGLAWHMARLVGQGNAMELLLSSRVFDADDALRLGFVSKVVPPDTVFDMALNWARRVSRECSPAAMAATKTAVYEAGSTSLVHAVAASADQARRLIGRPDFTEGVTALAEQRPPVFQPLASTTG
jgi:enoyl-CoA hydratase/carnithine racemase